MVIMVRDGGDDGDILVVLEGVIIPTWPLQRTSKSIV